MDIEGYCRYFTDIAHSYFDYVITVASACACFHWQWPKLLIQIENLGPYAQKSYTWTKVSPGLSEI